MSSKGGIWALGGYLYQFIGSLGIAARIYNLAQNPDIDESDLDVLITLIDVDQSEAVRVHAERFREDALIQWMGIQPDDQGILVQFKFSRIRPPRPISKGELVEIIETFEDGVRKAKKESIHITACILVSNRRFTTGRNSGESHWQKEIEKQRDFRLEKFLGISEDLLLEELRDFARRYGVLENEFKKGVYELIAKILIGAVERPESFDTGIFIEELVEALTGSRQAKPITMSSLADKCQEDLEEFERTLLLENWNHHPVPRRVSDQIIELISQRALVGLYGPGGCGKSFLLWHLIFLNQANSIYKVYFARDVEDNLLRTLVNQDWRNLPAEICPRDLPDTALQRVRIANNDIKRPIIVLGVDGLDENITLVEREQYIKKIVKWFWEKDKEVRKTGRMSDAVLIVTCRQESHLRTLLETIPDSPGSFPELVLVEAFDDDEFIDAFEHHFPQYLRREPLPLFARTQGPPDTAIRTSQVETAEINGNLEKEVLKSLHQPVVWRALLNLQQADRESSLKGENGSLNKLAIELLKWFNYKIKLREPNLRLTDVKILNILSSIAKNTAWSVLNTNSTWIQTAAGTVGDSKAHDLLVESELSGLIELASNTQWRWKHKFIYDYLVGL